jgi:hypothetical protein
MSDNWWKADPVATSDKWWEGDQPVSPDLAMRNPADSTQSATPSQPQTPAAPELTAGETAADVAKSLGIGAAQGVLGLATTPGNLEQLARLGFDKTATALGYADPELSKSTILPTYNDWKSDIEKHTGEFYEPKTTLGKYARTIGEFAPTAVVGPGGMAARALNVVAPAVASETAGELTEGTAAEPWARAAAGLAGGFVPTAAMRAITPITTDAARAAQVVHLQNEGVNALTAGQRTGNRAVRWFESAANDVPFNGGRGAALNDQAAEQFTQAALRRAGIQADRATPDAIDAGFTNLGNQFDALAQRNALNVDQHFLNDINQAVGEYHYITPESMRPPIIQALSDDLHNLAGGQLGGDAYQALRSRIEAMRRQSINGNPQFAGALGDIRDALDNAMARSASPADQAAWQQARLQYRNLLAIEKAMGGAGENTALGLISPSQLRTAVKTQNKRTYVRGQNELGNLARAGEAIMKPLPNSGTPARLAAQHILSGLGAVVGGAVGHAPGAVAGAFLPALAQGALARGVMSDIGQGYLANQGLAPALEWWNANRLGAGYRVPQAAMAATAGLGGLSGGSGPRYDQFGNLKPGQ